MGTLLLLAGIALVVLKLASVIAAPWIVVLLPFILIFALWLIALLFGSIAGLAFLIAHRRR